MEQRQRIKRTAAGVILAAGEAKRMGCSKLTLPWQGETILGRTIENAKAGGVWPLTVVSGAYHAEVEAVAQAKGLPCLYNAAYATGQSSSLQCGLAAVGQDSGVMYILGDQPLVPPALYAALLSAYAESAAWLVAPCGRQGRRGNPVIVAPQLFDDVRRLRGDVGARVLFTRYEEMALLLPVAEAAIHIDIDTVAEYERQCRTREE